MDATYILPLRRDRLCLDDDLTGYIRELSALLEVIVVDGSPPHIFDSHERLWGRCSIHVPVDPDLRTANGKVGGVLTGLRRAQHERVILADDDVRYDAVQLRRVVALLDTYALVRPQNYFEPLSWHARLDTARSLLNRVTGGDWPGTLGVRRSYLETTGGYDGSVLFENLELVRTVKAAGGDEVVSLDLYVRRHPPTTAHFWSQRIRQAYDELARPLRLAISVALLPVATVFVARGRWGVLMAGITASAAAAEIGRRRAGGAAIFPAHCSLLAPLWLAERAICIWIALGVRVVLGGVPYRGLVVRRAATPMRVLRQRHAGVRSREAMMAS